MARQKKRARDPRPNRSPAPARVRRTRLVSIVGTAAFITMFFAAPTVMGSPLFIVPTIIGLVALVATIRDSRRPDGPDAQTLKPDALATATKKQPIEVDGLLFSGGAVRAAAVKGRLRVTDRRMIFEGSDGSVRFDVAIGKVTLAGNPGFWRPQLDLEINNMNHTVRFLPMWDLGATFVGPIIAGEWFAQLRELERIDAWKKLEELGAQLEAAVRDALAATGKNYAFHRLGSMFCLFFTEGPVRDLAEAKRADTAAFAKFFHHCLQQGVYLAPSQFETGFLSTAHTADDLARTAEVATAALRQCP